LCRKVLSIRVAPPRVNGASEDIVEPPLMGYDAFVVGRPWQDTGQRETLPCDADTVSNCGSGIFPGTLLCAGDQAVAHAAHIVRERSSIPVSAQQQRTPVARMRGLLWRRQLRESNRVHQRPTSGWRNAEPERSTRTIHFPFCRGAEYEICLALDGESRVVSTVGVCSHDNQGYAGPRTRLLSLDEAAALLAVHRRSLYRLRDAGRLRFVYIGAAVRVRGDDIAALMEPN
jgi:excisionase family DNA binding protein